MYELARDYDSRDLNEVYTLIIRLDALGYFLVIAFWVNLMHGFQALL